MLRINLKHGIKEYNQNCKHESEYINYKLLTSLDSWIEDIKEHYFNEEDKD